MSSLLQEFDKKYNPTWHCIVGRNFGSYVTHETKHFIYFYLGQVAILLFKSGWNQTCPPKTTFNSAHNTSVPRCTFATASLQTCLPPEFQLASLLFIFCHLQYYHHQWMILCSCLDFIMYGAVHRKRPLKLLDMSTSANLSLWLIICGYYFAVHWRMDVLYISSFEYVV